MGRHERGSNSVEYALLIAMIAAIAVASFGMYRTVTFDVGDFSTPPASVQHAVP